MTKKYESRTRYVIHGAINVVVAAVGSPAINFTRNTSARRENRKTEGEKEEREWTWANRKATAPSWLTSIQLFFWTIRHRIPHYFPLLRLPMPVTMVAAALMMTSVFHVSTTATKLWVQPRSIIASFAFYFLFYVLRTILSKKNSRQLLQQIDVVVVVARSLQNTIKQVKVKENHDHILLKDIHRLNLRLQISVLGEKK